MIIFEILAKNGISLDEIDSTMNSVLETTIGTYSMPEYIAVCLNIPDIYTFNHDKNNNLIDITTKFNSFDNDTLTIYLI